MSAEGQGTVPTFAGQSVNSIGCMQGCLADCGSQLMTSTCVLGCTTLGQHLGCCLLACTFFLLVHASMYQYKWRLRCLGLCWSVFESTASPANFACLAAGDVCKALSAVAFYDMVLYCWCGYFVPSSGRESPSCVEHVRVLERQLDQWRKFTANSGSLRTCCLANVELQAGWGITLWLKLPLSVCFWFLRWAYICWHFFGVDRSGIDGCLRLPSCALPVTVCQSDS
jgi:hypothetical protein